MAKTTRCKAKNPATCPYHGSPKTTNSLKNRMNALKGGESVHFASYSKKAAELEANVVIKPRSSDQKTQPIYIDVKGNSYEEIQTTVDQILQGLKLKELKTGYEAEITIPNSDNEDSLKTKIWVTSQITHLNEDNTQENVDHLKQAISSQIKDQTVNNNTVNETINSIKDSKLVHSISGAKAIAVLEAMHEFKYFHPKEHKVHAVQSALKAVLNNTSEYTNRLYGVRVHMYYKSNGELREATFTLDDEKAKWNTFSKNQINQVNAKLQNYFNSFDK